MGVASSLGLISGINYQDLVSKLISLERRPVTLLQNRKVDIQSKMGALSSLSVKLSSLKAASEALDDESMFNTKSVAVNTSGTDTYLTATTTSSAAVGSYTVYVDQLAQAHKFASQGWADENSTAILDSGSYPSGGNFSFRIGDSGAFTDIQISTTTTLQELRDMINSADAGVSSTILNDGTDTTPYRLILTSDTSGASNDVQVTTNVTQLDFTNKLIEEATADATNSGTYTGSVTSNTMEDYEGTANKTYIIETMTAGSVGAAGDARYKYSTDGGITWDTNDDDSNNGFKFYTGSLIKIGSTDGTNDTGNAENVKVEFTAGDMAVGDTFRVDVFNPTFNEAQDAVIRVDTLTLVKDSNTISDVIDGVTLSLATADTSTATTVTVSQGSVSSAKSNIERFVSAYNTVITDLYNTFYYDPDNPTDDPLRGDYTVRGIQAALKDIVVNNMPGLTGDYTALYQIGISADTTGKLSIDDAKLSDALDDDPLSVMKLFTDYGTPTDNSITHESKTSATKAGTYSIYVYTPPAQATFENIEEIGIGFGGVTTLSDNETLTFSFTDEATEAVPTVTAFAVNLSIGDTINTIVSKLNSKFNTEEVGMLATNDGGALKITSTDYGDDMKFTVVSNQAAANQTGVGTTMLTKTGTDVVGTINGHAAYGDGKYLTGANGFEEEGLKISTTTTAAGGKGYIYLSSGVAAQLITQLESIT
ncbi:MAG: flagellar filament capping protein FliD, partial [Deltaproteobacteria bacterium]|nr:flagellar filament capping protein FliD [Deltaproteobacteria bacterium]